MQTIPSTRLTAVNDGSITLAHIYSGRERELSCRRSSRRSS